MYKATIKVSKKVFFSITKSLTCLEIENTFWVLLLFQAGKFYIFF
jgi:hypothetical protein